MPSTHHLPLATTPWEAVFVDLPARVDGVDLEGALLVVEATGEVRAVVAVAVGVPLGPVFAQACLDAAPPTTPARPLLVRCDAALAARLPGVPVEIGPTPAADEALGALRAAARPVSAPGLDADLPRWAAALRALVAHAPWVSVSASVTFAFAGRRELDDAVGVLTGAGGGRRGVVVFDDPAGFEAFVDERPFDALCVHLDPDLDAAERAACDAAGLVVGAEGPRAYALRGGETLPLTPAEQRRLLAATEAITALCGGDAAALRSERRHADVGTVAGSLRVTSRPDGVAATFVDVDHAVGYGHMTPRRGPPVPVIVVQLDPIDAQRVARRVFRVTGVGLRRLGRDVLLALFQDEAPVTWLIGLPAETAASLGALAVGAELLLCVSSGGAQQVEFDAATFVAQRPVRFRGVDERRHAPIFDGPVETWPRLADRLRAIAEAGFGPVGALPDAALDDALAIAQGAWNGVVQADFLDDPSALDRLAAAGAPVEDLARIAAMVARRRSRYPGDPRLVHEVRLRLGAAERGFGVEGSLPAGYRLSDSS